MGKWTRRKSICNIAYNIAYTKRWPLQSMGSVQDVHTGSPGEQIHVTSHVTNH